MARPIFQTRMILFDGACGFCKRTARLVHHLDWLGKVSARDFVTNWDSLQQAHPQLTIDACVRDMHVIHEDGAIHRGFAAYRSLAWVLPVCWIMLPFLYLLPVFWVGTKAYRYIADHRKRACPMPETIAGSSRVIK